MNISSTPFIRNDYWPDYNDIDILNKRIDEAENETSLVNSRLTNDIENVSNNLNSYKNEMADTVITNNIIVNNLNANYAIGKYANFANTNTDNAYIENLTVNKPVFDLTLNTPHVENITSIGGNFYDANLFNVAADNLIVNTQPEPVTSSAVLGYDSKGRVIPVKASFEVGFPENANYLFTDQHGTAFPGTAETEVNASNNLITSNAVYNALANVNNSFNAVNNTANNLLDNVDYLKNIVESCLLPANITGWANSSYPVVIQGITEFAVEPLSADYYPISPESDRIRFNGNYYEKSGNGYVKQNVTTYNTYDDILQVSWDNKYTAKSDFDEDFNIITTWKTESGTIATSGYYLNVDKQSDGTYIVKLLNLTFDEKGTLTGSAIDGTLYKLPSDFNFQDNVSYYVKNNNNFEELKVNQGQCTFTTNPATDNNFYIYQKGADWSYPNTTGPEYSILARNNVYAAVYSASSFPLYTEMGTMTAYVSDKAKLSVSGTKAVLALPGFQWTKANMDGAFFKCEAFNQNVKIPYGVTSMKSTFTGCLNFNQNIKVPDSVTEMTSTFLGSLVFNQNIQIPNNVTTMYRTFGGPYSYKDDQGFTSRIGCPNFNQNILIPNSVTNIVQCFMSDTNLNQNILIPNSVTRMTSCFTDCNNLNQPNMYIFSQNIEIDGMKQAFVGCHINNIHIPTSVPKDTSNFMYNCLVNGNTGITFPAANIFNDLPVDITHWPPFYYESVPSYWDDSHKYIQKLEIIDTNDGEVEVYTWKANNTLATSGYYLSIDEKPDGTFIVKLLNCTFINGILQDNFTDLEALYKQDYTNIDSLYIANGQSYEPLLLDQAVKLNTNPVNTDCIYRSVMYNN